MLIAHKEYWPSFGLGPDQEPLCIYMKIWNRDMAAAELTESATAMVKRRADITAAIAAAIKGMSSMDVAHALVAGRVPHCEVKL